MDKDAIREVLEAEYDVSRKLIFEERLLAQLMQMDTDQLYPLLEKLNFLQIEKGLGDETEKAVARVISGMYTAITGKETADFRRIAEVKAHIEKSLKGPDAKLAPRDAELAIAILNLLNKQAEVLEEIKAAIKSKKYSIAEEKETVLRRLFSTEQGILRQMQIDEGTINKYLNHAHERVDAIREDMFPKR